DGIRDGHVTGVQTCALPIFLLIYLAQHSKSQVNSTLSPASLLASHCSCDMSSRSGRALLLGLPVSGSTSSSKSSSLGLNLSVPRSEERRVGKECRCIVSRVC